MKFNTLNLEAPLQRGIKDRGYKEMTSVQEKTLVVTLQGRDVAVQSQTGTGKTAAFLITIYQRMLKARKTRNKKALIIVPTRELAVQVENEAQMLNRHLGFVTVSLFGGVGYARQLDLLKKGVDIIIGTPGRLMDMSERGYLNLKDIQFLVIDEADRLFDMGFLRDIKKLIQMMPPKQARQSMLFSATLNRASKRIASEYLNSPQHIEITPEKMTVDTINQELYHVKSHIKMNLMLGLLKSHAPQNALIFTNMRHVAALISKRLKSNGFNSRHLTGDLSQPQRMRILKDFSNGRFPFLVATDVAARGLHIDDLEMVINYDIPQDYENYVHRIGRTARAGNSGVAITLASEKAGTHLEAIESFIGMKIPVHTVTSDLYAIDSSVGQYENWKYQKDGDKRRNRHPHSPKKPPRNRRKVQSRRSS